MSLFILRLDIQAHCAQRNEEYTAARQANHQLVLFPTLNWFDLYFLSQRGGPETRDCLFNCLLVLGFDLDFKTRKWAFNFMQQWHESWERGKLSSGFKADVLNLKPCVSADKRLHLKLLFTYLPMHYTGYKRTSPEGTAVSCWIFTM